MKLEHFGMPEPGDCRVVFSASAEELEAAVQAEPGGTGCAQRGRRPADGSGEPRHSGRFFAAVCAADGGSTGSSR